MLPSFLLIPSSRRKRGTWEEILVKTVIVDLRLKRLPLSDSLMEMIPVKKPKEQNMNHYYYDDYGGVSRRGKLDGAQAHDGSQQMNCCSLPVTRLSLIILGKRVLMRAEERSPCSFSGFNVWEHSRRTFQLISLCFMSLLVFYSSFLLFLFGILCSQFARF